MCVSEKIAALLIAIILAMAASRVGLLQLPLGANPTLAAAIIAALVGVVTVAVNATMNAHQHREKIRADIDLAERRFAYDRQLAEAKVDLERKLHLDKRRAEFAESALKDFYEAKAKILEIRSPASFAGENDDRIGRAEENQNIRAARDQYYPTIRRIRLASDFFTGFYARRFTALALFGPEGEAPYVAIWCVISKIQSFAYSLMGGATRPLTPSLQAHLEKAERAIWYVGDPSEEDEVMNEVTAAIRDAEGVLRPAFAIARNPQPSHEAAG